MISTIMLKYVMPQKIVFFGSGWFVVPVIKTLINHGLAFVVTNESEGEVVEFCKANNISGKIISINTQTLQYEIDVGFQYTIFVFDREIELITTQDQTPLPES